jgi:uncharacterized protein (UPF0332 family)
MMAKAKAASTSARLLLEHGDMDGAANRAYYAMFDAARAALMVSGAPVDLDKIKTHSGLIGAFSKYLVKDGPLSKDLGRCINKALEIRMSVDYDGVFIELDHVQMVVEQAEAFITALQAEIVPDNGDDEGSGPKP